jgi:dTDP-4-amino-4,6-dideoxygalactose transaminase
MNAPENEQKTAEPIMVTQSVLPPLAEYSAYLSKIWDSHRLTNNGPLVQELEERLREYLGVPRLWYVNNCMSALQLSLKALGVRGEVITTPFSYVATAGSVLWENCSPIFVDVRPGDLTIDPALIERSITPRTTAIVATHVYGFPCDVTAIETLARHHGLAVVYDAAHTFGCRLNSRHLASYGDVSCLSFHATKIFHTVEGGAVIANSSPEVSDRLKLMRAFGHFGDDHRTVGINAKNSELHAAMGLCNLPRVATEIERRRLQTENYRNMLSGSPIEFPAAKATNFDYNFAYCAILLPSEEHLLRATARLAEHQIFPRRYFYPSLNIISYLRGAACPVSEDVSRRVLCLPLGLPVTEGVQQIIARELIRAAC